MTAFGALAEPHRREILELLRDRERPAGDLVERLDLSQPGVSKHLKVLREAGLVAVRAAGKQRFYALRAAPLAEVDAWLEPYRAYWSEPSRRPGTTPGGEPMNDDRHLVVNGYLDTVDGRPALRFERRLGNSVERVWRAVTEPEELGQWFLAAPRWSLEVGDEFSVEGHVGGTGRITELDPPRLLAYDWDGEHLRFDLRPDGDGCLLVFTHVFDDRVLGTQHAPGWEGYLARLDAHLAGDHLPESEAHARAAELNQRYAERFGIDPQVAKRMFVEEQVTLEEGPMLRLERHFDHPVERLWRAITDPGELLAWFPSDEALSVTDSNPPRLLEGTWYGEHLRFELRPEGEGCRLVFTHAFADPDVAARTAAGWDRCFARLDALLLDQPMSESASLQLWPKVHEHYAEEFGVDPEIGRKAYAEHPLT